MATKLPAWNLELILKRKDIPEIIKELTARVNSLVRKKKQFRPTMSVKIFKQFMTELEQIERGMGKLGTYASNWYNENTRNQQAGALRQQLRALGADIETKLLFINQEWKRFDNKNAARLIKACPEYAYHLKQVRKGRKHMLSDEQEEIINIKDVNGSSALSNIYTIITTGFTYDVEGKTVSINDILRYIREPNAKRRKAAYDALLARYEENKNALGQIYMNIVDDWGREAKLRKYPKPISVWNRMNDLPDEAVETLLRVCKKNYPVFQAFFKKKAKLMGVKKLRRCDIYAPLKNTKENISWNDAVKTVKTVYKEFHPAFYQAASRIIDKGHIHAQIHPNKQTGAYCSYPSTDIEPYVLLSFNNTVLSTGTLIHELGHGVHGVLAEKQNQFNHHAPLPVCETASIFSELLLGEYLVKKQPKLKRDLAAMDLEDYYASIARQVGFVLFEIKAHEMVANHATIEELSDEWMRQLKIQFGNSVDVSENFRHEWLYIPHIYKTPFYCYAYAFGNLLSLAFFAQYKKNPQFADKIVHFLAQGGSKSPQKLVKEAGFDLTDEKFWQGAFDVIKKKVRDL